MDIQNDWTGTALDFDGVNDYIDCGSSTFLDLTGSRSISAWIKPDTNGSYNTIAAKDLWGYSLFVSNGKLRAFVAGSIRSALSTSLESIIVNKWQHVAMTFDFNGDKEIHLYINGVEVDCSTHTMMEGSPTSNSAYNFTIGSDGAQRYFDGQIDDVKVYSRMSLRNTQLFFLSIAMRDRELMLMMPV